MEQDPKLTNVHEAIAQAALESAAIEAMKNYSLRLPPSLKDATVAICERNGTDLSSFLRQCCQALVEDYKA